MTITELIESDILTLSNYFKKLFDLESQQERSIARFIKPDMACNIYSLVDFWIKELCHYQERKNKLTLGFKDIKGENELAAFHKYLTKVVALDLSTVEQHYKGLQSLRKVRNKFIHDGGHILSGNDTDISNIEGVRLAGSLIVIADKFIWESLEHANAYMCLIAKA